MSSAVPRFSETVKQEAFLRIQEALRFMPSPVARDAARGIYRKSEVVTLMGDLASSLAASYMPGTEEALAQGARDRTRRHLAGLLAEGRLSAADAFEVLEQEREVLEHRIRFDQYEALIERSGGAAVADQVLAHIHLASLDSVAYDMSIKHEFPTDAFGPFGTGYHDLMQAIRSRHWDLANKVSSGSLKPFTPQGLADNIRVVTDLIQSRLDDPIHPVSLDPAADMMDTQHAMLARAASVYREKSSSRQDLATPRR